jgi:hypothetical protein
MRRLGLVLLSLFVAASPAAYADWNESAKECAEQIAAQAHCASCSALWPQISKCAADHEGADAALTDGCIARVNNKYWAKPMYFDRVAEVFSCLSK